VTQSILLAEQGRTLATILHHSAVHSSHLGCTNQVWFFFLTYCEACRVPVVAGYGRYHLLQLHLI